jgi:hypothetical protein
MPPGPRAGFSMCVHKKRAILFGGVVDTEVREVLQSTFINEMYAFQMDNRRWYPLELRKLKIPKGKASSQLEAVKSEDLKGGSRPKRKANGTEMVASHDPDVAPMDTVDDQLDDDAIVVDSEGLAKRIEGSEAMWPDQLFYGGWSRYTLPIWRHDGSWRQRSDS